MTCRRERTQVMEGRPQVVLTTTSLCQVRHTGCGPLLHSIFNNILMRLQNQVNIHWLLARNYIPPNDSEE